MAELIRKVGDDPVKSYALAGRLVISKSGWALLEVPNAIVHGLFSAMHAPGIELPYHTDGRLNAHISVMRREELETAGGKLTETGKQFRFQIGPLKEVAPMGWDEISKVWFVEVKSPELEALRRSYGLNPLPVKNGRELQFHITVAVRRKKVLYSNEVAKTASLKGVLPTDTLALESIYACG